MDLKHASHSPEQEIERSADNPQKCANAAYLKIETRSARAHTVYKLPSNGNIGAELLPSIKFRIVSVHAHTKICLIYFNPPHQNGLVMEARRNLANKNPNTLFVLYQRMGMEDSTLLVAATFMLFLSFSLLGLFLYLFSANKSDSRAAITLLQGLVKRLNTAEQQQKRAFKDLDLYMARRLMGFLPVKERKTLVTRPVQVMEAYLEPLSRDLATQTHSFSTQVSLTDLPPLLVKSAVSSDHVIIPIGE